MTILKNADNKSIDNPNPKDHFDMNQGIDLRDFIGWATRKLWIIVICALLGGAAFTLYSVKMTKPSYKATASLYLVADEEEDRHSPSENRNLAAELTELMKERRILAAIADQVPEADVSDIKNSVQIKNPEKTALITISAYSGTAKRAYEIAEATSEITVEVLDTELGISNLKVFTEAELPESASNIKPANSFLLGSAAGSGIGFVGMLLYFLMKKPVPHHTEKNN